MRRIGFLILLGLLVLLAACQGEPPPTPTAIPLAATVPPPLRPTRPPATAMAVAPSPGPTPQAEPTTPLPEPSPTPLPVQAELEMKLARQTVMGFLERLRRGEYAAARTLYLTEEARAGEAGRLLDGWASAGARLEEARPELFLWAGEGRYEAQAELRWAASDADGPATQTMNLALAEQRGLWLIDEMTLGPRRAATPTPGSAREGRPARPALGGRLVFQVSSGGDIYTIAADGSRLTRLTDGLDPAWSPDGRQIAFCRWREPVGVYLVSPAGENERRVVHGVRPKEVAWSPDGSRLAFTVNYGSDEPTEICFFGYCFTIPPYSVGRLWTADLASGDLLSLPLDDQTVHSPTWRPDGRRIVYAGDRGLAWIDLDTMEKGRFADGGAWDGSPAYAPDGRRIAFMGRVHDHWEIFSMDADGANRQRLTFGRGDPPASSVAPAWSPDGRQIVFLSNRDGPWRLYVMNADGSDQRAMFGAALDGLGIRYEWASERVVAWGP